MIDLTRTRGPLSGLSIIFNVEHTERIAGPVYAVKLLRRINSCLAPADFRFVRNFVSEVTIFADLLAASDRYAAS